MTKKLSQEEREWVAFEEGYSLGYESGVLDFEESNRRKEILRRKGISVIGDKYV
jgi:hypothetical protein